MKSRLLITIAGAAGLSFLAGCTTAPAPVVANNTRPTYTVDKKVYPKEELDKRGRQNIGAALAAEDPSITYHGR